MMLLRGQLWWNLCSNGGYHGRGDGAARVAEMVMVWEYCNRIYTFAPYSGLHKKYHLMLNNYLKFKIICISINAHQAV